MTKTIEAAAPATDTREADLAAREAALAAREAALAASSPAAAPAPADDLEAQRRQAREERRHELVTKRAATTDPEARRQIALELNELEAADLVDLAADLAEAGISLVGVIKKAAHNAFGVAL